jgi:uncharacterized membrane protein
MDITKSRPVTAIVILFIGALVVVAVLLGLHLLAVVGVLTGMLFLSLFLAKAGTPVDEREQTIKEKAANATYAIFAPTIGIGAFILLLWARGEFLYLEALGIVFAYLTLFLITLYAISYHFFSRKYGGGGDEE